MNELALRSLSFSLASATVGCASVNCSVRRRSSCSARIRSVTSFKLQRIWLTRPLRSSTGLGSGPACSATRPAPPSDAEHEIVPLPVLQGLAELILGQGLVVMVEELQEAPALSSARVWPKNAARCSVTSSQRRVTGSRRQIRPIGRCLARPRRGHQHGTTQHIIARRHDMRRGRRARVGFGSCRQPLEILGEHETAVATGALDRSTGHLPRALSGRRQWTHEMVTFMRIGRPPPGHTVGAGLSRSFQPRLTVAVNHGLGVGQIGWISSPSPIESTIVANRSPA